MPREPHGGETVSGGDNLALSRFEIAADALRLISFSQPLAAASDRVSPAS